MNRVFKKCGALRAVLFCFFCFLVLNKATFVAQRLHMEASTQFVNSVDNKKQVLAPRAMLVALLRCCLRVCAWIARRVAHRLHTDGATKARANCF